MQKKKETTKKKATKCTSNVPMTWDGKNLVNNVVYMCDNKKTGEIQAFMFKPGKKSSKQYSVMTEFENVKGHIIVYNNGIGPDLTLKNIREAPADTRERFFKAAQESNLEFDSKNNIWNYTAAPSVNAVAKHALYEPFSNKEDETNKDISEENNIYCFITLDETKNEYTQIIGEVKQRKKNMVYLDAWAYSSEPEIVRSPSQIIVHNQYDDIPLTKLYKFSSACVSLKIKKDEKESKDNTYSKGTKDAIVRFMNRIINDALKSNVYVVNTNNKYYVYPCYEECNSLTPAALCEITKELEIVCPSGDVSFVFGAGVVIDKDSYGQILEEAKNRKEKETTKIISDALDKAHNQETDKEEQNVFTTTVAEKPGADNSPVSCNILFTRENGNEYYRPGIYETTHNASMSLYADAADDYIIINVKDDSIIFRLTDDAQSVLHSRHLNSNGKTCVFGPIRDAHKTYDYIVMNLRILGWNFNDCDSILYRNENCDLGHLLKDVIEMQIDMSKKHYGYRLIQPSLNFFK